MGDVGEAPLMHGQRSARSLPGFDDSQYQYREGGPRDLTTGPRAARSCTDLFCLILFAIGAVTFAGLAIEGATRGNTEILDKYVHPLEVSGSRCGEGHYTDQEKIFYFSEDTVDGTTIPKGEMFGMCTSVCPSKTRKITPQCNAKDSAHCKEAWDKFGVDTFSLGPYCINKPLMADTQFSSISILESLYKSWPVLIVCFVVTIIAGFVFLFFLEQCVGIIAWALVIAIVGIFTALGIYAWVNHTTLEDQHDMSEESIKAVACISWALAVLTALLAMCFHKSINLSVGLLKCAAAFLLDVKSQMVSPLFFALFHILYFCLWVGVLICVLLIGAKETCENQCTGSGASKTCYVPKKNPFCIKYESDSEGIARLSFLVVMLLWVNGMISALSHFQTSYAAGVWYFSEIDDESREKKLPGGNTFCDWTLTFKGMFKGLWFHTGSFAFGALLVTIAGIIRAMLSLISKKSHGENGAQRVMLCCSMAICGWLDKLVAFASNQAYVQTALLGSSFCESGKSAFALSLRYPGQVLLASRFSDILELLGSTAIMTGVAFLGVVLLQSSMVSGIEDVMTPIIVISVISFTTALTMMHPYSTATMAILHCFIADEQMSEYCGFADARHIPEQLKGFLDEK